MSQAKKKGRFIVHFYPGCPFEREVSEYFKSCSQEDIRHLLSQGSWLEDLMKHTNTSLSDPRFDGTVPDNDGEEVTFYVRFVGSGSKMSNLRTLHVWEQLQRFSTFPGRLTYLRKMIFRGYLVEHAFTDRFASIFSQLMPQVAQPSLVQATAKQVETSDILTTGNQVAAKKAAAKNRLGGLM